MKQKYLNYSSALFYTIRLYTEVVHYINSNVTELLEQDGVSTLNPHGQCRKLCIQHCSSSSSL